MNTIAHIFFWILIVLAVGTSIQCVGRASSDGKVTDEVSLMLGYIAAALFGILAVLSA